MPLARTDVRVFTRHPVDAAFSLVGAADDLSSTRPDEGRMDYSRERLPSRLLGAAIQFNARACAIHGARARARTRAR